jgi:ketosteroid isomerase-like protein
MVQERTELNRNTIHRAFEGWQQGTANIADIFAAEMIWRIEGRSVASKEYRSKKAFVDEVLAPFAARFTGSSEPFRPVRIRALYADGDAVVVLWDGRGIARDGKPYENSYAWFLVMRDGRVVRRHGVFRPQRIRRSLVSRQARPERTLTTAFAAMTRTVTKGPGLAEG